MGKELTTKYNTTSIQLRMEVCLGALVCKSVFGRAPANTISVRVEQPADGINSA